MKAVIVLPTYNERDNILPLLAALRTEEPNIRDFRLEILVVDDSSPDGTGELVRDAQQTMPNLHLLIGQKKGLGAAYIRGITHALDILKADAVLEMDADFSHDPRDVKRLLVNIAYGADFVIGSRYVPGGTIPGQWSLLRRLNSSVGNFVARNLAGLTRVRDCTAGFRAISAALLHRIDLKSLKVQGYAFQVTLLHEAIIAGARVVEIPVDFTDRTAGESKLGIRDILEFILNAAQIRLRSNTTFIKFSLVGLSGVAVNLIVFSALLSFGFNKLLASALAIEASIIGNFILNNQWTFKDRARSESLPVRGLKFNAVSLISLSVSFGTFMFLQTIHPDGSPVLHQLVGIAPAMVVNYFMNSYWTFRRVKSVTQETRGPMSAFQEDLTNTKKPQP